VTEAQVGLMKLRAENRTAQLLLNASLAPLVENAAPHDRSSSKVKS
jgi:hypothetical protein